MHPAIMGALAGLGLAIVIYSIDYMVVSRNAAERAARYKRKPEFEPTEKTALASLFRFLLLLPPAGALLFWVLS
ncbi:MAG: hypothetical protein ACM30H_09230 [Clostridia bacterium]